MTDGSSRLCEQRPRLHQYQVNCCKTRAYPWLRAFARVCGELQASYKTLRTASFLRNEDLVLCCLYQQSLDLLYKAANTRR